MLIEVKIGALIMDPNTNTPIVVLKGINSETILPIWVGAYEANAIALEIEKVTAQRPVTHDLLKNFIVEAGFSLAKVIITDLRNNTFYALLELKDGRDKITVLDSRPSDAIALALRLDCAIFVEEKVFDISARSSQTEAEPKQSASETAEDWPDLIS
jgi:bifunctional DNase/RNase